MLHCTGAAAPFLAGAVGLADPTLAEASSATSALAASTVFLRIIRSSERLYALARLRARPASPGMANLPTASEAQGGRCGEDLVKIW